jgi:hypothetical protein
LPRLTDGAGLLPHHAKWEEAASRRPREQRALSDLTSGFATAGRAAAAAAAAFARKIVAVADEWTSVNARLKQASTSRICSIQRRDGDQSNRNIVFIQRNLFSRAAASMREFATHPATSENHGSGQYRLKLSVPVQREAGSVITQFSQALAQVFAWREQR